MKTKILFIICAVVCAFGVINAQSNAAPNPNNWNYWQIPTGANYDSSSVAYHDSRVDTLFRTANKSAGTRTYFRVGGHSLSSLTFETTDSCDLDFVVKARTMQRLASGGGAAGAWATILSDSFAVVASTGLTREYSLRDTDSDLFDGLDQEFMVIITHVASGNDTQGTGRRKVRLNHKD